MTDVGDIFESDVRPVLRRLLHGLFASAEGKNLRRAIMEENPRDVVKLVVNGRYPDTIPLSSMPPQVLKVLPQLPPELEYRFIDRTLILLDVRRAHHRRLYDGCRPPLASRILRPWAPAGLSSLASSSPPRCARWRPSARGRPDPPSRHHRPPPVVALPNRPDSFKFAVIGDFGTGDRASVPSRRADGKAARALPLRARHHRRGQHLRRRASPGHEERSSRPRTRPCSMAA